MNPYNQRGRFTNYAMNAAAAAGGAAARVATTQFNNWLHAPPPPPPQMVQPYNMVPLYQALPPPVNARRARGGGRGRGRGRGRRPRGGSRAGGQPSAGIQTRSGSSIVIRDTEIIGAIPAGAADKLSLTAQFNPSVSDMPRLAAHAKMYRRYRIKFMNIAYKSGSGTATDGNVALGIEVGPLDPVIKSQSDVLKLRPSFFVPAWKNASITVGKDIDLARFMLAGDSTADGVAFTLYVWSKAANPGVIQVSYEVEFSHPHPF